MEVTTMNKTPLVGKQVTIVCDEATLQELYELNDHQWDNFNEAEFMFFIGEVEDTELNDEQMEFYGNYENEMIECPNHEGAYDCTPFCRLCEGNQGYVPEIKMEVTQ